MSTRRFLPASIVALLVASFLAWPVTAEAQRRGSRNRTGGRSVVIVAGGIGFPGGIRTFSQRPWGRYGPWGPYGGPYPGYYYGTTEFTASARIEMEPKEAEVFVDGAFAGLVDDFDGFFQRLNVRPGEHEITLYLEGYRTERHTLYFSPGTTQHIKGTLEALPAGQKSGPRPEPAPMREPEPRIVDPQRAPRAGQYPPAPRPAPAQQLARFGTISLKVLPVDADIIVDGERWTGPGGVQRLTIQLSPGRHHLEVQKEGYVTYVEDVLIRSGATLTLNVSLTKK